jgi:hypothetical protein
VFVTFGLFRRLIKVKPGLYLVVIAATIILLGGCSKPEPEERSKKIKEGNLQLSVTIPKGSLKAGKKTTIKLAVENVGREIEFLHFNTEQRYDVEVKDSGDKPVWRWSQGRYFGLVRTEIKLEPEESEDYEMVWSLKDAAGNQIPPGKYSLTARGTAEETTKTVSIDIKVVK